MVHTQGQGGRRRVSQPCSVFWTVALGTAAFWMLVVWSIHRNSPRTLVSFHGFLHAAIAERFLSPVPATFPPENPFYAGEPLAYYWFFQFLAALLSRLLGWNIFYAFEALLIVATGALMILAVYLGHLLFRSLAAGILIGYLVVAGTNALGWLFAGIRLLAILWLAPHLLQADQSSYLWGVVHPLYSLIRFNDYGGLYGPLLNFFLNLTSRPAALAAVLALVCCLERALRSRTLLACLLVGGVSALMTALSPITGLSVGGALLAGLAGCWFWGQRLFPAWRDLRASQRATYGSAGVAIVAGLVAAGPTFYHLLTGPSAKQMKFGLVSMAGSWHLATVTLSIAPLAIMSVVGMRRMPQERRLFLGIVLLAACVLLTADVMVVLPAGNSSNFFHAAVVLLAIPAVTGVLRGEPSGESFRVNRRRAAGVVLLFLPTLLLLLAAYWNRPPLPADFAGPRLTRVPHDSDLGSLYSWVQQSTSQEAMFVLDPRQRVAMCGNIAEFPAMTGRVLFTEERSHYVVEPYPDAQRRFDLAVRLMSGERPDISDQAYLSGFQRPVYIVSSRAMDGALTDRLHELYGPPAFHQGGIAVFTWIAPSPPMLQGRAG